jgi:hypothetical protein
MMGAEDHMIVKLLADHPDWQGRVFKVSPNLDIAKGFKNREESEFLRLCDALKHHLVCTVPKHFFPVKAVCGCSACEE